jgi:hypothetical protein
VRPLPGHQYTPIAPAPPRWRTFVHLHIPSIGVYILSKNDNYSPPLRK